MKTVLVTGGTIRLGKVISDYLVEKGWRVIRSSHRTDSSSDVIADLSTREGVDKLFSDTCDILGSCPDAIVNNAALFSGDREILTSVNLNAPLRLNHLLGTRGSGGSVVNILDCKALSIFEHRNLEISKKILEKNFYLKSKVDLLMATHFQAEKFLGKIRVNAVAPGPVMKPTSVHEKAGVTPFGRPTPQAVAEAVQFLLSAEFVTDTIIPVDGGQNSIQKT